MPAFLPDTSCMVAAVCTWHEFHERAAGEIDRRLGAGETMMVAAPALAEAYSVLTRLPPPHRLSPADTLAILEADFIDGVRTVALDATSYHDLLRRAPADGVAGGRIYDAIIAACARKARVAVLLTFNPDDFRPFATDGLTIVVPGLSPR